MNRFAMRGAKIAAATLAVTAATLSALAAHAAGLTIGSPAPPLAVKAFVKGAPVTALPKGKVSVVEFWATWCGPCKASIPHLTEMAKKYPKVTFVGVSVWENDQAQVAPFVKQMGEKMDYHVAMDKVPTGARGENGAMAKTWMTAAGQDGIPTAFIVGPDGKIDWIGHPMEMEEPLAQITAGKWDLTKATADIKKKQAEQEQMQAFQSELQTAAATKDSKKILAVVDAEIAKHPDMEASQLGVMKYSLLQETATPDEAQTYLKRLITVTYKDNAEALNELSWSIVDPEAKSKADAPTLALALQAARQADSLTKGKDGAVADTLAAACYANGDMAGAVAAETRAVTLTGPTGDGIAEMKKNLAKYKNDGNVKAAVQ